MYLRLQLAQSSMHIRPHLEYTLGKKMQCVGTLEFYSSKEKKLKSRHLQENGNNLLSKIGQTKTSSAAYFLSYVEPVCGWVCLCVGLCVCL